MEITREACAKICEPILEHRNDPDGFIGGEEGLELCEIMANEIRNCSDCLITFE